MDEPWYESHQTLVEVARHAHDQGDLTTAEEVIDFFEQPWKWPEFHDARREAIKAGLRGGS